MLELTRSFQNQEKLTAYKTKYTDTEYQQVINDAEKLGLITPEFKESLIGEDGKGGALSNTNTTAETLQRLTNEAKASDEQLKKSAPINYNDLTNEQKKQTDNLISTETNIAPTMGEDPLQLIKEEPQNKSNAISNFQGLWKSLSEGGADRVEAREILLGTLSEFQTLSDEDKKAVTDASNTLGTAQYNEKSAGAKKLQELVSRSSMAGTKEGETPEYSSIPMLMPGIEQLRKNRGSSGEHAAIANVVTEMHNLTREQRDEILEKNTHFNLLDPTAKQNVKNLFEAGDLEKHKNKLAFYKNRSQIGDATYYDTLSVISSAENEIKQNVERTKLLSEANDLGVDVEGISEDWSKPVKGLDNTLEAKFLSSGGSQWKGFNDYNFVDAYAGKTQGFAFRSLYSSAESRYADHINNLREKQGQKRLGESHIAFSLSKGDGYNEEQIGTVDELNDILKKKASDYKLKIGNAEFTAGQLENIHGVENLVALSLGMPSMQDSDIKYAQKNADYGSAAQFLDRTNAYEVIWAAETGELTYAKDKKSNDNIQADVKAKLAPFLRTDKKVDKQNSYRAGVSALSGKREQSIDAFTKYMLEQTEGKETLQDIQRAYGSSHNGDNLSDEDALEMAGQVYFQNYSISDGKDITKNLKNDTVRQDIVRLARESVENEQYVQEHGQSKTGLSSKAGGAGSSDGGTAEGAKDITLNIENAVFQTTNGTNLKLVTVGNAAIGEANK